MVVAIGSGVEVAIGGGRVGVSPGTAVGGGTVVGTLVSGTAVSPPRSTGMQANAGRTSRTAAATTHLPFIILSSLMVLLR